MCRAQCLHPGPPADHPALVVELANSVRFAAFGDISPALCQRKDYPIIHKKKPGPASYSYGGSADIPFVSCDCSICAAPAKGGGREGEKRSFAAFYSNVD